jgi:hypothetical protein
LIYLFAGLVLAFAVIAYQQFAFSRLIEREREAASRDRAALLQRIQDPMTANAVQAAEALDVELPRHFVEFDDDEDFDVAKKMLGE